MSHLVATARRAALPAHGDLPTRESPHGVQLLHCLVNTVAGGESVMVDGVRVAEDMREAIAGLEFRRDVRAES